MSYRTDPKAAKKVARAKSSLALESMSPTKRGEYLSLQVASGKLTSDAAAREYTRFRTIKK